MALGIRRATSTIINFPAIVLTPAFTFWTFGPISSSSTCNIYKKNESKIHLSYRLTCINALFTTFMTVVLLACAWFVIRHEENHYAWYEIKNLYIEGFGFNIYGIFFLGTFILAWALAMFSVLSLVLVMCLGKCSRCPLPVCPDSCLPCLPMRPKTEYDTTDIWRMLTIMWPRWNPTNY